MEYTVNTTPAIRPTLPVCYDPTVSSLPSTINVDPVGP